MSEKKQQESVEVRLLPGSESDEEAAKKAPPTPEEIAIRKTIAKLYSDLFNLEDYGNNETLFALVQHPKIHGWIRIVDLLTLPSVQKAAKAHGLTLDIPQPTPSPNSEETQPENIDPNKLSHLSFSPLSPQKSRQAPFSSSYVPAPAPLSSSSPHPIRNTDKCPTLQSLPNPPSYGT